MRILIVDDDEVLAHMLGEQLRRLEKGFDVVAVNSAEQARLAVKEAASPFAAFVLDQRLEGSDVNGVVLMGQLRDLSPESDAIILTGYNEVEAGIAAFDLGAYRYLTKPFDTRELVYVLKSIEKSRGIRNERNWLQILTEVTTAMQSASTVQAVADAIVQGALHFDFKRARLRLFVEQGQEAQGDPEMVGVSQAGTARLKGFAGLRAPLKELMYSQQAIEAGKPMIFKAREAGKGGTDEFYAAQGMQPPVGEWVEIPLLSGSRKVGTLTLDNAELDSAFSAQQRNQI
ncbi:MAG: response regulator, partial [Caldilineales bacterium]